MNIKCCNVKKNKNTRTQSDCPADSMPDGEDKLKKYISDMHRATTIPKIIQSKKKNTKSHGGLIMCMTITYYFNICSTERDRLDVATFYIFDIKKHVIRLSASHHLRILNIN